MFITYVFIVKAHQVTRPTTAGGL